MLIKGKKMKPAEILGNKQDLNALQNQDYIQYVTFSVQNQLFGIPALLIEEIVSMIPLTKIPLAPKEIEGTLNLRGRIVTVLNTRILLGLPDRTENEKFMNIVIADKNDLYCIVVDKVDEVMVLQQSTISPNPSSMNESWQEYSDGVFQIKDKLLIILKPEILLKAKQKETIKDKK
jgi:purine-binding chemotaxis protein CheW